MVDRASAAKFDAFQKSRQITSGVKATTTDFLEDKPTKKISSIRFSDDLTVKDGQKFTPELIQRKLLNSVGNTREQVAAPFELQAREFQNSPTIDFNDKLLDGFYCTLQVNSTATRSYSIDQTNNAQVDEDYFPVKLVVDKRTDQRLSQILTSALSACSVVPSANVRVYLISQVVASSSGGGFLFTPDQIRQLYSDALDGLKAFNTKTICIGDVVKAWSVARALLFKYLCDRLEVPCKISLREVLPSFMPSRIQHGIAWIRIGGRVSVVDLLGNIGGLYENEAAIYYEELALQELDIARRSQPPETDPVKEKSSLSQRWFEEINLSQSQVQRLTLLGKGRYGQVYKAKVGNFICALKVVRMESMTKDVKKAIHKEVSLMRTLKHDNIVSYLGQEVVHENELHLFLELVTKPLDKLVDSIKAKERVALNRSELLLVAKAVVSALKYIHNLPTRLMHRDVKARNVLVEVDDSGFIIQAKLCDFGLATEVTNDKENQLAVGTARWMAPEVHAMQRYDEKADIWSFGMLLYELCAMKLPYHEICVLDVKQEIMKGRKIDLNMISTDWQDVLALIAECTKFDPTLRPSASEVLEKLENMIK